MLNNFFKCANWIEENCPKLNGVFECRFNTYYWTRLVVENGKSYLECGSHGSNFTYALSKTETATFSIGSMQSKPYAYKDTFFFRNERLEEFLSQWETIKKEILNYNIVQCKVYSDEFTA